ncbi:MAG TPA: LptE family protein [Candidatus Eisenbacteria bacterium]|nr:LptE family protein [Candidatus Eisenbacteria bacterium]
MPRRATSASCRWLGALPALLVVLAPGCGYTVSSVLPSYIRTVAIPTFANNTVEHGLADDITQALINSFLADRRLRLERERDADAVLRGTVLAYRNRVYAYTSQEVATQYEILLTVKVSLRDQVKNREIWKEDALTVRTTYNVVPVGSEPAKTEADGRKDVIQKLADQIVSRTVQGW